MEPQAESSVCTETVSSRSTIAAVGAVACLAVAAVCAWIPGAPDWARWVSLLPGLAGLGSLYRFVVPVHATLIADGEGVRWSMGGKPTRGIQWRDVRSVHRNDDDGFYFNVGKAMAWQLPSVFLRTPQAQARFVEILGAARPDLQLGRP